MRTTRSKPKPSIITNTETPFAQGDRLLISDWREKKGPVTHVCQIRDKTQTSFKTPDGRHFIAYTYLSKKGIHLTPQRIEALKAAGLIQRKAELSDKHHTLPETKFLKFQTMGDSATLSTHSFYARFIESTQEAGSYRSAWEWAEPSDS